jgi:uncharacterized protein (TIGR02231 family)
MKNLLKSILLAGTAVTGGAALADDFTLEAPIESVIVYRDGGAQITRTGRLSLPAGRHTVTLTALSSDLDEEGRPTLAFGGTGVRTLKITLRDSFSETPASERQRDIGARMKAVEADIDTLRQQMEAKRLQLEFVRSIKAPGGEKAATMPVADWETAVGFIGTQAGKLLADIRALEQGVAEKQLAYQALQRELAATGERRQDFVNAVATVDSERAQEVPFSFTYFMEDAGWSLDTAAALDTAAKRLDIDVTAQVEQETGEDWRGVALALSTTSPSPELGGIWQQPVILGLAEPRAEMNDMMAKVRGSRAVAFAPELALEEVVVTDGRRVRYSGFDRLYEITAPATVPATGEEEFLPLDSAQADASLVVRVQPGASTQAYLFADTRLDSFDSQQDVTATLTRDGHYVGRGTWPDLIAGTPLELPFGHDRAIAVTVTRQAPDDGDSGLFGRNRAEETRLLFSVTNNATEPRTVELFDQVPVAGHEDIEVKTLKGATKPTETDMDGKQGLMMWRKTLAPGEEWQVSHAYRVTYPEDKRLLKN